MREPLNWNTSRLLRSFHSLILFVYSRPASDLEYYVFFDLCMPLSVGLFCGFFPVSFTHLQAFTWSLAAYLILRYLLFPRYRPYRLSPLRVVRWFARFQVIALNTPNLGMLSFASLNRPRSSDLLGARLIVVFLAFGG